MGDPMRRAKELYKGLGLPCDDGEPTFEEIQPILLALSEERRIAAQVILDGKYEVRTIGCFLQGRRCPELCNTHREDIARAIREGK